MRHRLLDTLFLLVFLFESRATDGALEHLVSIPINIARKEFSRPE
jgi:hypothetical protein